MTDSLAIIAPHCLPNLNLIVSWIHAEYILSSFCAAVVSELHISDCTFFGRFVRINWIWQSHTVHVVGAASSPLTSGKCAVESSLCPAFYSSRWEHFSAVVYTLWLFLLIAAIFLAFFLLYGPH